MRTRLLILAAAIVLVGTTGCPRTRYISVAPEVNAFVRQSRVRDLRWAEQERTIRFDREANDKPWGRGMAAPADLNRAHDVEPILDDLYGDAGEGR
ncbi:MAG: hypothetical protein JXO22_07925 [Phycisphaerae bacterium]|nr:hypothetical protein [Phycisphaerae bacterium]